MNALLLFPLLVFGDVGLRNGGTYLGPVRDLDCSRDGGLLCVRDAGTAIGSMSCASATTSNPGCITPSAQSFAGDKTFTGTVKAPVLDAGVLAVGSTDLRGSTFTNLATASPLTIVSNTANSTTSTSQAAMVFKLGADLTDTDLGWTFQNFAGTSLFNLYENGVMEFGTAHFTTLQTNDGAGDGLPGEDLQVLLGDGATSGGVQPGGTGGDLTVTGGTGGTGSGAEVGGVGGNVTITSGTGGLSSGSAVGGVGGETVLAGGSGGTANGTYRGGHGGALTLRGGAAGTGGDGANVNIVSGPGGNGTASYGPGNGGMVVISSHLGGAASAGGTTGGTGGNVYVIALEGGSSVAGQTSGTGGALVLQSGGGGSTAGGTGASGGTVTLDTGAATGAATAATMSIGATNAGTITLGRSGQSLVVNSYGVLTTHGTTVLAVEKGSTAMTANELAVTFATAFGAAPACTCTHVNTTNNNACNIKAGATPTTTTVTFAVASGGTDVVEWICIGTR